MSIFERLGASYATLVLRLGIGGVFLLHGAGKIHSGVAGVTGFFASLGIPFARVAAIIVIVVESIGAVCVLLGVFTRFWAACMTAEMLVAILTASLPAGRNFELEALLLAGSVALVTLGDGTLSVGSRIRR